MPQILSARRGINALLEHLPNAEVASITNQNGTIRAALREALHPSNGVRYIDDMNGPWTCVDLYFHNEKTGGGEIKRYAIWNSTGDVYQLDGLGEPEDDPIIKLQSESEEDSEAGQIQIG